MGQRYPTSQLLSCLLPKDSLASTRETLQGPSGWPCRALETAGKQTLGDFSPGCSLPHAPKSWRARTNTAR